MNLSPRWTAVTCVTALLTLVAPASEHATAEIRSTSASASLRSLPARWWGATVDNASDAGNLRDIVDGARAVMANNHPKLTTRIVFDPGEPPSSYTAVIDALRPYSYLMGEIVDSSSMKHYSLSAYHARTAKYLDAFAGKIDIWEIGNEVNGEWTGSSADVAAKISDAFDQVKARGLRTALTLYYNPNCWDSPAHEMFTWARQWLPSRIMQRVGTLLISYYEQDCNGFAPSGAQWQTVFNRLHVAFPNSRLGFGETGTTEANAALALKTSIMKRYYGLTIHGDNYIGGYFWWYYAENLLPPTQSKLWPTFMSVLPAAR
jgi:hypothetical protein